MDLRLDGPVIAAEFGSHIGCILRTVGDAPLGDGNAEAGKQLLGLILVNVHGFLPYALKNLCFFCWAGIL